MATQCYAMVRGSVARFTLLDRRGAPVEGETSVVTTKGIAQVQINEATTDQSLDLMRDEEDRPRVLLRGKTETTGYTADISLAGVDPDLIWMLTGQPRVTNAAGDVVGNDATLKLPVRHFAMEVWSRLTSPVNGYLYGYTLFPRLGGGVLGGFAFSNGAVSFSINEARSRRVSKWGFGPYTLRWDGESWHPCGLVPIDESVMYNRMGKAVGSHTHWRTFLVDSAPVPQCGAQPLYDVIDNGFADHTSTDVVDGQFVITSSDIIDGGGA